MHPLFAQFQCCLLGRLKTRLLTEITKSLDEFPSQRDVLSAIMAAWRRNSEWGRAQFHLIYCHESYPVEVPAKMSRKQVGRVLDLLGRFKPITRLFAEEQSASIAQPLGMLLLGHTRPNGQPGYYVTIFREDSFPNVIHLSIVPSGSDPARIDLMGENGWTELSPKQASTIPEVRLVMATLWERLTRQTVKPSNVSEVEVDESQQPPLDDEFMRRIRSALKSDLPVSIAWVAADKVRPFNLDFCLKLNPDDLDHFVPHVETEPPIPLVTYWDGDAFVMSDDYYTYAAYRKLGRSEMRLAVLGEFPTESGRIEKEGGPELLPPFVIVPKGVTTGQTVEFKNWLFEEKLRGKDRREVPSDLAATWLVLADILGSKQTSERRLHNFLRDHPTAISAYATKVESEVGLGGKYRIDLLIRSSGVREEITLVELEHHRHPIFTAEGRPHHKVTHACQQVRDWIQWLGENPDHPLSTELGGINPSGLVIMGRSDQFTSEDRRLLANLNASSAVQVLTYDELLDRFRDLILSQCDNARW